jgi:hypothetical protein
MVSVDDGYTIQISGELGVAAVSLLCFPSWHDQAMSKPTDFMVARWEPLVIRALKMMGTSSAARGGIMERNDLSGKWS